MSLSVLVIDDDPAMRHVVAMMLKLEKYEVRAVASMVEAIEAIDQQVPHVICCDLMMTELNGLDFLRYRNETEALRKVPVLIITATGEDQLVDNAYELGAFSCLAKPFARADLVELVRHAAARASQ